MKNLLIPLSTILLLSATWLPAQDQFFYVRSGATGTNDGSDWNNAYRELPGVLARGATYYVAGGSYPAYTFDDPENAAKLIVLRKATDTDHGTGTGWNSSYGTTQAVFGRLTFSRSYFLVDGAYRYGFKVMGGYQGWVVVVRGNSVTLKNIDIDGNFSTDPSGYHTGGACGGLELIGSSLLVEKCDVHNAADDGIGIYNGQYIQVLESRIHNLHGCGTDGGCGPCSNGHSDGFELQDVSDVILKRNIVFDIKSTSALITGQWTSGAYTRNLILENNIFYTPDVGICVYLYYVQGAKVFNNVFWGRLQGSRYGGLAIGPEMTGLELHNNIMLNINFSHLGSAYNAAEHGIDYNLFGTISSSEYAPNAHDKIGNPMFKRIPLSSDLAALPREVVGEDFSLQSGSPAIDRGMDTGVLEDFLGGLRPKDGDGDRAAQWDLGALEYGGSSGDQTAPSAPENLRVE